jgi:hypothetical protein
MPLLLLLLLLLPLLALLSPSLVSLDETASWSAT